MVVTLGTDDRKHPHIQRLPNAAPWITSSNFHRAQDTLSSRTGGKLGEFIGRSKAPKIKLCVFLGTSTRNWRPLCLCRWAWAAGGAFTGRQGTKKEVRQLDFRLRRSHRKHEIILSASLGRMSPSHSDGLTGEFLGQGSLWSSPNYLTRRVFLSSCANPSQADGHSQIAIFHWLRYFKNRILITLQLS